MNDVYRLMANEPEPRQLRSKTWRYLIEPIGDHDPMLAAQAKNYWELQEKIYGLEMSDFTISVDRELRTFTTFSVIKRVKPGKRVRYERQPDLVMQ